MCLLECQPCLQKMDVYHGFPLLCADLNCCSSDLAAAISARRSSTDSCTTTTTETGASLAAVKFLEHHASKSSRQFSSTQHSSCAATLGWTKLQNIKCVWLTCSNRSEAVDVCCEGVPLLTGPMGAPVVVLGKVAASGSCFCMYCALLPCIDLEKAALALS